MNSSLILWMGRNRGYLNSSPNLCQLEMKDNCRNRGYLNRNLGFRLSRNRVYLNYSPDLCQAKIEDI